MTTYIPVISDVQAPLHDRRAVDAVATFLADQDLDSVCVGDVADLTQVSQWVRGRAGEYDGQLGAHRDIAVKILEDLRVKHLSRSNHDDRIERYVSQHGAGLSGLPELRTENFLRLSENGITFHRKPYRVAPGWLLMHGDEGPLVKAPGGTALGLSRRTASSVVCGHTHKLGLTHEHGAVSGRVVKALWGLEVGHMMDMTKAGYLKAGHGNWQTAFGILVVDGPQVVPFPIPIVNGKFYWDGKTWKG